MRTLIASGFGSDGGGLFALGAGGFEQLDTLETVGLAVSPGGDRLARALVGYLDGSAPAHLLMYDASGVQWYRRAPGIHDVHGLIWTGDDELAAISTATNSVHWLGGDGIERRSRRFAEAVDAWHLNCPAVDLNGRLVVSAFAQTDEEQGWRRSLKAGEATGALIDVDTGTARFAGLRGPHDPLALPDGTWLVNDSASGGLAHLAADGTPLRAADLGGWTRGLVLGPDGDAFVGLSSRRHEGEGGRAAVARVDLNAMTEVDRWSLASDEVFSLAWVAEPLLSGVRRGFGAMPGHLA